MIIKKIVLKMVIVNIVSQFTEKRFHSVEISKKSNFILLKLICNSSLLDWNIKFTPYKLSARKFLRATTDRRNRLKRITDCCSLYM